MKVAKVFSIALLFALLGGGVVAGVMYQGIARVGVSAHAPANSKKMHFVIEKGAGPMAVARGLEEKGIITDAVAFTRYLRFVARKTTSLKAGEYEVSPSMTGDELIAELSTGKTSELRFTVREGLRKEEIARIISDAGFGSVDAIIKEMNAPERAKKFGVPSKGAGGQSTVPGGIEGYLFPDTYQFPPGTSIGAILDRMRARLDDVIDDEMKTRMKETDWDLHKVLTLAAIVEKETGQASERPHIASVFKNRIKLDMKLQTDPTVIYGIEGYDGNIRKKDLTTPHPYNTYVIKGMPPGPIASPGREAIHAALFPDENDDLFFVSKNDGTHIFCPTLACHNAAVEKWQVEYFRNKKRSK